MTIYAVVVAYYPDLAALAKLVSSLEESGCVVVLVDNTPGGCAGIGQLSRDALLISPLDNLGIASAHNLGIERALSECAHAIALFDQDSELSPNMISALAAELEVGRASVVVPVCVDSRSGKELPSFKLKRWLGAFWVPEKIYSLGSHSSTRVELAISSGMMATAEVYRAVGGARAGLFIDFVDFEWCLRCRWMNVPMHVIPTAVMKHSLGERQLEFGLTGAVLHGSERTYYKVRNGFLIMRLKHVPKTYALRECFSAVVQGFLLIPFATAPMRHFRALVQGVFDGLRGKEGRRA